MISKRPNGIVGYRPAGIEERIGREMIRQRRRKFAEKNLSKVEQQKMDRVAFGVNALYNLRELAHEVYREKQSKG